MPATFQIACKKKSIGFNPPYNSLITANSWQNEYYASHSELDYKSAYTYSSEDTEDRELFPDYEYTSSPIEEELAICNQEMKYGYPCPFCNNSLAISNREHNDTIFQAVCDCGFASPWEVSPTEVLKHFQSLYEAIE